MAAANGPVRTIFAVVLVLLIICIVGLYLLVVAGESLVPHQPPERTPVSTSFHDHRVDRWTKIDLA